MKEKICPDCGARWTNEQTCIDHFYTMGFWELDHQLWDKHHLMVLSYNLQHPHLYSPQALAEAQLLLKEFLETDTHPEDVRHRINQQLSASRRQHKITGTPQSYGQYTRAIKWTMTCADVLHLGIENYYDSIDKWAQSILKSLIKAEQMP